MREHLPVEGSEIDMDELTQLLEAKNLKGMVDPIGLIMELNRVNTYERLASILQRENRYGHFELETTDVATFHKFLGNSHPEYHPARCFLIISKEGIEKTLLALQTIIRDTRMRIAALMEEDDNQRESLAIVE